MPTNWNQRTLIFRDYTDAPSSSDTSSTVAVSTDKGKSRAITPDVDSSFSMATPFDDAASASSSSVNEFHQPNKGRSRDSDAGQPRKKAKNSIVWMYFSKTPAGDGTFSVVCQYDKGITVNGSRICGKTYTYSRGIGSSTMLRHLKEVHKVSEDAENMKQHGSLERYFKDEGLRKVRCIRVYFKAPLTDYLYSLPSPSIKTR